MINFAWKLLESKKNFIKWIKWQGCDYSKNFTSSFVFLTSVTCMFYGVRVETHERILKVGFLMFKKLWRQSWRFLRTTFEFAKIFSLPRTRYMFLKSNIFSSFCSYLHFCLLLLLSGIFQFISIYKKLKKSTVFSFSFSKVIKQFFASNRVVCIHKVQKNAALTLHSTTFN